MIAFNNGFQEVVALVKDSRDTARRLQAIFGFEILAEATVEPAALALLGLDAEWTAQEVLLGDPAQQRGYIRCICVDGQRLPVGRDGGQAWDSGGIFDFNIRALRSIEDVQSKMTDEGFIGHAPVTHWQFGPLDVKEVVLSDADGLCIALMQRLAPPLTGYEQVEGPVSYVFNSTQVVRDFDSARAFYVDHLGWQVVQETTMKQSQSVNCMGLPLDVARDREMRIGIYQANGKMEGSVEIIAFDLEGLDFSDAPAASRGIAALRFPLSDPRAMLDKAAAAGCQIEPLRSVNIAPYGQVEMGAFVTPWGARFQPFRPL